jgi:hypothetical protein
MWTSATKLKVGYYLIKMMKNDEHHKNNKKKEILIKEPIFMWRE